MDLDDEPQPPQLRLHDPLDAPLHHERLSADRRERNRRRPALDRTAAQTSATPAVRAEAARPDRRPAATGLAKTPLALGPTSVLLAAAGAAGAGGLAGQYIAYHFDELARQDQYRPWFQQLCPQIGCTVPSKVDIAKIKSSNLVVRSHPEFSGALVVDAIIYNRAPFLSLSAAGATLCRPQRSTLIARSVRFKPGEYLNGDLEGMAEMPPQTPIHIALDILDPGAKAVNYSLSFHSPE